MGYGRTGRTLRRSMRKPLPVVGTVHVTPERADQQQRETRQRGGPFTRVMPAVMPGRYG